MWDSDDETSRKRLSEMSAALNIPINQMQSFVNGQMAIESMPCTTPTRVTLSNDQPSSSSESWSGLQTPRFYSPTTYESTAFVDILSGSGASTPLQPLSDSRPSISQKSYLESPFRSPPFPSDTGTLMELSTVTPSRIKNSPTGIITKKLLQSPVEQPTPFVNPSRVLSSSSSKLVVEPQEEILPPVPGSSGIADQFQIVIGDTSPTSKTGTTTYEVVDLNNISETVESNADELSASSYPVEAMEITTAPDNEDLHEDEDDSDLEDSAAMPKTLGIDIKLIKESKKRAKRGGSSKLPKELRGLMGEANVHYARGDHKGAIKMCMEVIRLAPYGAEPFELLSMIYDEKGDAESSLQYSLLAAHLSKTDAVQWMHLADLCLNQGDSTKALGCYLKAARVSPKDHKIQIECGKLNLKMDNVVKAMHHYKLAIACMPPDEGDVAIRIVRDLSKLCHDSKHNVLGIGLLEQAFESHRSLFEDEDANLLCELYLMEKLYMSVFEVLSKHAEVDIKYEDSIADQKEIVSVTPPSSMPVDLLCKLAIAGIRLDKSDVVKNVVSTICTHNPADVGDIQFELAETYMAMENYSSALKILDGLVSSPEFALAAVWLRHAECHRFMHDIHNALSSYKQCVKMAPGHVTARLQYSKALRSIGKYKLASQTLDNAEVFEMEGKEHMRLYYERYTLYQLWGDKSKQRKAKLTLAADAALLMFVNKFRIIAFKEARMFLVRNTRITSKSGHYRLVHKRPLHQYHEVDEMEDTYLKGDIDIFSKEEWLNLFDETISLLFTCERFSDAENLAEGMLWHNKWCEHLPTRRKFEETSFCTCILAGDYKKAYTIISPWLRADVSCNQQWNIFNQLIAKTEDQRHQKFCLRLLLKNTNNLALVVLTGHNWMASGFYRTAIGEYMHAHREVPTEPLYLFMLGVAFVNLTSQKFTDYKNSFVAQALAYFEKYLRLRGFLQECYYNIGRGMQQLGLAHFAIHYYEKALSSSPAVEPSASLDYDPSVFDLRREIGFNLSLIYRTSGNHKAANEVMSQHCVV